jgi:hypothetical protein
MLSVVPNKPFLAVLLGAGLLAGCLAAYHFLTGHAAPWWSMPRWVSAIIFISDVVILGGLGLLWRWLWKVMPALNCWVFPDLNGKWEGAITSTYDNDVYVAPEIGRNAVLTIRQGWKGVLVELETDESKSFSTETSLAADRDLKRFTLKYSYINDPSYHVRKRSQRHDGTAKLVVNLDADPNRLKGQYYTDRNTAGEMEFVRSSIG